MMFEKHKFLIGSGLLLILLGVAWRSAISPRWMRRLSPGWSWHSTFVGTNTFPDPATGQFPATDAISIVEKGIRPVKDTGTSGPALLEDFYKITDPGTGKKTWEYISRAQVDLASGAHQRKEFRGDIYVFPRSVRKQTYRLRWNYVRGVPLSYLEQEEVEGIQTFVFDYKGYAEYSEPYAGTVEHPGVKVAPGQEIRCRDNQFRIRVWVEPVTGEILKMNESCPTGDYIYETATGKLLKPILRWTSVTAGDDVTLRAGVIWSRKTAYLWMTQYVPWTLALSGILATLSGWILRVRQGGRRA